MCVEALGGIAIIVVWSFIVPTIIVHMEYDTILCYFLTEIYYIVFVYKYIRVAA